MGVPLARRVLALIAIALILLSAFPLKSNAASVIVNPIKSEPRQGGYVYLVLSFFPPNSTIYILLDNGTLLGITVTDFLGSAEANVSIPMHVWPGTHEIVAVFANGSTLVVGKTSVTIDPYVPPLFYDVKVRVADYATKGEEVTFFAIVKQKPTNSLVDPSSIYCKIYSPNGTTITKFPSRVTTGVYSGSFTPTALGTYGVQCTATVGGNDVADIDTLHVTDIQLTILNDLAQYYQNLTNLINNTLNASLDKLRLVESNLTDLINNESYKIIAKINQTENNLSAIIISKVNATESNITDQLRDLYAFVYISNSSIHNAIDTIYNKLSSNISIINSTVNNLTIIIRDYYTQLTYYIQTNATKLLSAISSTETNISGQISNEASYLENLITQSNQSLYILIQSESGNIQSAIISKINTAENNLTDKLDTIQTQIAQVISLINSTNTSIHTLILNKTGELIAFINSTLLSSLGNLTIDIQSNVTDLINDRYIRIMQNIDNTRSQLSGLIISRTGTIEGLITNLNNTLIEETGLLADLIAASNESLHLLITSDINTVLNQIDNAIDEIRGMNVTLHTLIRQKAAEILQNLSESYNGLYALVSDMNVTIIGEITNATNFLDQAIKTAKQSMEENLSIQIEQANNTILLTINGGKNSILAAISSANETLHAYIGDQADRIVGSIVTSRTILGALIMNVTKTLENNLTVLIRGESQRILYKINMTNATIRDLILTSQGWIVANITNGVTSVLTRLGKLETNLTSIISSSSSAIQGSLSNVNITLYTLINNKVEELQGQLIGVINKSTMNVINTLSTTKQELNASILAAKLQLQTIIGNVQANLNTSTSRLENIIITSKGDIIAAVNTSNETLLVRLGNVEQSMLSIGQNLDNKINMLMTKLSSVESNISENVRTSADEIKSVASNYGVSSTTASVITLLAVSGLAIFMRKG